MTGDLLLDEVESTVRRYVVLPSDEALVAVTVWIAATHVQKHLHTAPRLAITSPEKRCGKSRLLDLVIALSNRPLVAMNATVPAIFRSLDEDDPRTLVLDEADAIWSTKKSSDGAEDLRALVNAGFERGRPILRCVGPNQTPTEFTSFGMVALAGIGNCLPETVLDRAIRVTMRRRNNGEQVSPFRSKRDGLPLVALNDRLGAWAREHGEDVTDRLTVLDDDPAAMPLEDRAADVWAPLMAVADVAGGAWPARVRGAALALVAEADAEAAEESAGVRLLTDVEDVFTTSGATFIPSAKLVAALRSLPDAPWEAWDLDVNRLSRKLRNYAVKPDRGRAGDGTQVRGYRADDLADAFARYVSAPTTGGRGIVTNAVVMPEWERRLFGDPTTHTPAAAPLSGAQNPRYAAAAADAEITKVASAPEGTRNHAPIDFYDLFNRPTGERAAAGVSGAKNVRYALAAADAECAAVENAPVGQRNALLNTAAFNLGQLVAGGHLDRATVEATLTTAARQAGLDDAEIAKTIASGLRAGGAQPRGVPEPTVGADIPPISRFDPGWPNEPRR